MENYPRWWKILVFFNELQSGFAHSWLAQKPGIRVVEGGEAGSPGNRALDPLGSPGSRTGPTADPRNGPKTHTHARFERLARDTERRFHEAERAATSED